MRPTGKSSSAGSKRCLCPAPPGRAQQGHSPDGGGPQCPGREQGPGQDLGPEQQRWREARLSARGPLPQQPPAHLHTLTHTLTHTCTRMLTHVHTSTRTHTQPARPIAPQEPRDEAPSSSHPPLLHVPCARTSPAAGCWAGGVRGGGHVGTALPRTGAAPWAEPDSFTPARPCAVPSR